jgi:hypothetical protein
MANTTELGQFISARAIQLRTLLEGHFLTQGFSYQFSVYDGKGEHDWLFIPGYEIEVENWRFILSLRGHMSRLMSSNPDARDMVRWIEKDTDYYAVLSDKNDIIAYEISPPREIIDQVLAICNSAVLPG